MGPHRRRNWRADRTIFRTGRIVCRPCDRCDCGGDHWWATDGEGGTGRLGHIRWSSCRHYRQAIHSVDHDCNFSDERSFARIIWWLLITQGLVVFLALRAKLDLMAGDRRRAVDSLEESPNTIRQHAA